MPGLYQVHQSAHVDRHESGGNAAGGGTLILHGFHPLPPKATLRHVVNILDGFMGHAIDFWDLAQSLRTSRKERASRPRSSGMTFPVGHAMRCWANDCHPRPSLALPGPGFHRGGRPI